MSQSFEFVLKGKPITPGQLKRCVDCKHCSTLHLRDFRRCKHAMSIAVYGFGIGCEVFRGPRPEHITEAGWCGQEARLFKEKQ